MTALLEVRALTVEYAGPPTVRAVDGVDLAVAARERLAIVGESGSGKSQLLLACAGLLGAGGRARGSVLFGGRELIGSGEAAAAARGRGIGFVFQDAGGSLTPHRRIGDQLVEVARAVRGLARATARAEAISMLERVRLGDADRRLSQYPHELSGGMRQRVALALALIARPRILFADEPTTALDVTIQSEVVALIGTLCDELGMALLLVTHDLGVVASVADRIAVMYAGRIVEIAGAPGFLGGPRHPYGAALLAAVPVLAREPSGELPTLPGAPPRPGTSFEGCRFEPRCARRAELCRVADPALRADASGSVACHFPLAPAAGR